jgi:ubiquinone/menaquinone biosynthesis C-methylase UbiE
VEIETDLVRERFERRKCSREGFTDPLDPAYFLMVQERQRKLVELIRSCGLRPMRYKRVFEVGCGVGDGLLELIRFGYDPQNLTGCDLLEDAVQIARHRLPQACTIISGDASTIPLEDESFDIVMQSTVFTSLLNEDFQRKLSDRMWRLVKPGGGIVWYDFVYNNPRNPDVRGVPLRRVRELFPEGSIRSWRVTLAPPIGRRVTRLHPRLYGVFNAVPLLRTHLLCWIAKN